MQYPWTLYLPRCEPGQVDGEREAGAGHGRSAMYPDGGEGGVLHKQRRQGDRAGAPQVGKARREARNRDGGKDVTGDVVPWGRTVSAWRGDRAQGGLCEGESQ